MRHLGTSLLITLPFWIIATGVFGQNQRQDPVFIQIDDKLGKVVYHRVLKNETLYGISQIYGVDESSLRQINPQIRARSRPLPAVVKVPIDDRHIIFRLPLFKPRRDFVPVYYVARRKENPYRISRVIFNMPTNLFINRNDIEKNRIKEGQTLHIGWLKRQQQPLLVHEGRERRMDEENAISRSNEQELFEVQLEDFTVVTENQVAFWNKESRSKGMFVMHRNAPARSFIEIVNPMYNKVAYAKVIGKLPDHLYSKEIDMVVSEELATKLGVVDPKFFVKVRYQGSSVGSR